MKFSIITPVYNGEKYLEETIKSVLSQEGDFEIEYIICDGNSSDGTLDIIEKYNNLLKERLRLVKCNGVKLKWTSEKDEGMYDAINKGFKIATGDVYAYINSDDLYLPGAFSVVAKAFNKFPEIQWLKGITNYLDKNSITPEPGTCFLYNQAWIKKGIYGRYAYFIQQDSVFWRSNLWKKAGPIDSSLRMAGDYYLWVKFSNLAPLWSINRKVSCFRKTDGQLSKNMTLYRNEQMIICPINKKNDFIIRLFFGLKNKLTPVLTEKLFEKLYCLMFPKRNKYYIDIELKENLVKKEINSYKVK